MSSEQKNLGEQLSFDLQPLAENCDDRTIYEERHTVVTFLDARTLAVRRDAIRRVRTSGIFELPVERSGK